MLRGKMPLMIAGALGILAGLFAWQSLRQKEEQIKEGWQLKPIIVAAEDIIEGTAMDTEMISRRDVPEQFITDSVVTPENYKFVVGQKLAVPLKKGDPILWSHFQSSKGFERLSNVVAKKFRAVSINVSEEASVGQFVRPNDHVDIVGTFRDPETRQMIAVTLLQNVIVLATGSITGNTNINILKDEEKAYKTVTVMVLPEETEMLVLALQLGNLIATLRNSEDISVQEERGRATITSLLTGERMKELEEKRGRYITVIKGATEGRGGRVGVGKSSDGE